MKKSISRHYVVIAEYYHGFDLARHNGHFIRAIFSITVIFYFSTPKRHFVLVIVFNTLQIETQKEKCSTHIIIVTLSESDNEFKALLEQ